MKKQTKILLIAPSNIIHMPYINNYISLLIKNKIDFKIINWDRNHIEEQNNYIYRNSLPSIKKGFWDYKKYGDFIIEKIEEINPQKIVIFSIQLGFFMNRYLKKNFKHNYVLDIRDKNKIMYLYNFSDFVKKSKNVVISSNGFLDWLPRNDNYLINHNINISQLEIKEVVPFFKKNNSKIIIGTVGTIRDERINQKLINEASESDYFKLSFYGDGLIKDKLKEYADRNKKNNVDFFGRYEKKDENEIIKNCDFISVLRYGDSQNNMTALPNRLYTATLNGKPLIAHEGTYLSKIIKKFGIGLVIKDFNNFEINLHQYYLWLQKNWNVYISNREKFFEEICSENNFFEQKMSMFFLDSEELTL